MMQWREHALVRQWRQIPGERRMTIAIALWALALVALWQLAWVPGQARLQQAEQALAREQALAAHLQRVSAGPARKQEAVQVLTPARLSERAQAAGVRIIGLEARAQQVDVSFEGSPAVMFAWLHALEREGGRVRDMQLQVMDDQLQARVSLELDEA
ncbi:type II secretion system protein M [Pseudomonas sp. p1(2021b)]|uniref:type II secretion system protein GspM n=1 Tax=Pseudomonas sp. p1(2021b) TaxID=2874628 RepID=UPI001CCC502E|nr:type II secretion system protein GspM [Pseudomonas sp. p1(2021b)]UBM25045.1 type II secretion system protein M [Pseudomonas sp. p1(2021b)]